MAFKTLKSKQKQFLKDNSNKSGMVPKNLISYHVRKMDYKPSKYRANNKLTNVTDLIHLCPRQYCMMLEKGVENFDKRTTSSDRIVWAIGRAVENHVRQQFIEATNYKPVYGQWKFEDGYIHKGFLTDEVLQHAYENMGYKHDFKNPEYKELPLIDNDYQITGSPDLLVQLPNKKLMVTEIKTIKRHSTDLHIGFEDLEEPLPDHRRQPTMYHRLGTNSENKLPLSNIASIVYVCKDYLREDKETWAYKEFMFDVTDSLDQSLADGLYEKAKLIKNYRQTGEIPVNEYCASMKSKQAKDCSVVTECFA